jgi:hypothetical protein
MSFFHDTFFYQKHLTVSPISVKVLHREALLKERISTIDLRVLPSLTHAETIFFLFAKQPILNEEVNCTHPSI